MKGFIKDGKFRPTEKRNKSSLKKKDLVSGRDYHQSNDNTFGFTKEPSGLNTPEKRKQWKKENRDKKSNDDLVIGIIRAESGEMDNEELREFVLKHQDTLMQLQGSWQRTVQSVLEQEEDDVVSTTRVGDPDHPKVKYGELTRDQKTLVKKYVQKHPDVVRFEDFEWDNFEKIENANPSEFIHSAVDQYIEELYDEGHKD